MTYKLYNADCLDILSTLPDQSIDLILTDPPYGVTDAPWDTIIPFEELWPDLMRIVKPRAPIVLFGSQPFSSNLITSNPKWFKQSLVWDKVIPSGFLTAKNRHMGQHEDIVVFARPGSGNTYNPQMVKRTKSIKGRASAASGSKLFNHGIKYTAKAPLVTSTHKYPTTILSYIKQNNSGKLYHPTQKPTALLEYLIRTFSNEGATVLDFTMGSGSTGVAAIQTDRDFIGIEMDDHYYQVSEQRISSAHIKTEHVQELVSF